MIQATLQFNAPLYAESDNTDNAKVYRYLIAGHTLTHKQAEEIIGTTRIGARVYDINKRAVEVLGHPVVESRPVTVPKRGGKTARIAQYYIINASAHLQGRSEAEGM